MSQHPGSADPGPVTLEVPASHQALGQKLKNSYSEYSGNLRLLRHLSQDYSVWLNLNILGTIRHSLALRNQRKNIH